MSDVTLPADTSSPLPPPFPVGARVRYRGTRHVRVALRPNARVDEADAWVDIIAPGIEVTIVEVREGRRGTGRHLSDEDGPMFDDEGTPYLDETRHGYSVYRVGPEGSRQHGRCIRADAAQEWERIDGRAFCRLCQRTVKLVKRGARGVLARHGRGSACPNSGKAP